MEEMPVNKEKTLVELLNMASENYKQKVAISKNNKINYFCYKFDAMALRTAMNRIFEKGQRITATIISENRQEWLNAYIANIIMGNDVIVIPNNTKQDSISKIINKYQINTIFYSNKYREKTVKIIKDRKIKKENIRLNLINFDQEKNLNVIDYNKIMNAGRYLENNFQMLEETKKTEGKTTFIIQNKETTYSSDQIIENTLKIIKKLHIWNFWNKKITATQFINNEYDLYFQVYAPLILGNTINYDFEKYKRRDLIIQKSGAEFCEICKRKKVYRICKEQGEFVFSTSKKKNVPRFKVMENQDKTSIIKSNYKESFILIK